jgi:hypothetical protein
VEKEGQGGGYLIAFLQQMPEASSLFAVMVMVVNILL